MAREHFVGAKTRWALAGAAAATLLVAQTALASIPQSQSAGGGVTATGSRRMCSQCALTESQKRTRIALEERLDSLRWEVEHRRLSNSERAAASRAIDRTIRELDAAYAESMRENAVSAGQREAIVQRARTPSAQAYGYSYIEAVRTRGYLGVTFDGAMAEAAPPNPDRIIRFFQYPRIALVEGNSPAERAGVLVGDTVLALNGDDLREREFSFAKLLIPNAIVTLRVQRAGSARDLKVKVGETPEYYARRIDPRDVQGQLVPAPGVSGQVRVYGEQSPMPTPRSSAAAPPVFVFSAQSVMGARFETVTEGLGKALGVKSGVLVIRSGPGTPAYRSGLRDGDVVVRVGNDDVATVSQFLNALNRYEQDGEARLLFVRDGKRQDLTLRW